MNNLPFTDATETLEFYRHELDSRIPDEIAEELGPVMQQKRAGLSEKYARNIFCLGEHCMEFCASPDWTCAPEGDLEWTCTLAHHHHLEQLAWKYRDTGDEKFAEAAIFQMTDWIDRVPKPDLPEADFREMWGERYLKVKRSNWRVLETGFRIGETWPLALKHLIKSPSMTPEVFTKILNSIHQQAQHLHQSYWLIGNHSIMETSFLAVCGIVFREFSDAKEWLEEGVRFLMSARDREFYPDGYSRENSGGYRWVMVRGYFNLYCVAEMNGMGDIFPAGFPDWLRNICKAELYQLKPDFSVPVTNESNSGTIRKRQLERILGAFEDSEIQYVLSRGADGNEPSGASYFYPDAGFAVMRSDWSEKALYMSFDVGKKGRHCIGDQLSVEVSAYGRKFLVNGGRWRYTTSDKNLGWMRQAGYFKSSASCNTVFPAGYTQVIADAEGGMEIATDHDIAKGIFNAGYSDGEKSVKMEHRRVIYFNKPNFWIVRDIIESDEAVPIEQLWHFAPENDVELLPENNCAVTRNPDANLIIMTLAGQNCDYSLFKGSDDPIRGWHCPEYSRKVPAYELAAWQTGPCVIDTLIFPVNEKVEKLPVFKKSQNEYIIEYCEKSWKVNLI
jgi:hypothetical protein